jgi:hypothetical protein
MESFPKGTWIDTMDDGTLYFKNVSLQCNELKTKSDKQKEYEHTEANCILELSEAEGKYDTGQKYYHSELKQFITIYEIEHDDDEKITKYKLK